MTDLPDAIKTNTPIPPHVVTYWRKIGKSDEWIKERNQAFVEDWNRRHVQNGNLKHGNKSSLPGPDMLIEQYKKYTLEGIARQYGVTRERIRQIISKHPDYEPRLHKKQIRKRIVELKQQGSTNPEIAEQFDISPKTVGKILRESGLKQKPKPIGCQKCKTHPYARGVCHACYMRWLYRGKPNVEAIKEKRAQSGPKPKSIGCEDCKTNPKRRGLCGKCYGRWLYRGKPDLPILKPAWKRE